MQHASMKGQCSALFFRYFYNVRLDLSQNCHVTFYNYWSLLQQDSKNTFFFFQDSIEFFNKKISSLVSHSSLTSININGMGMLLLQILVFVSLGRHKMISQSPKYGRDEKLPAGIGGSILNIIEVISIRP